MIGESGRLLHDLTKWLKQKGHHSGLNRVSTCLQRQWELILGDRYRRVYWSSLKNSFIDLQTGERIGRGTPEDHFITLEQFHLGEKPGMRSWLSRFRGKTSVFFYDTIPYDCPETSWPRSVKRFPKYFKDLQEYDQVLFISEAAKRAAERVAPELGVDFMDGPVIPLGGDPHFDKVKVRMAGEKSSAGEELIFGAVGILDQRKGQLLFLEAAENLWKEGYQFRVQLVGREHPISGKGIVQKIKQLKADERNISWRESATDDELCRLYLKKTALVLASQQEGYGLPVVEGLFHGLPVICSEQPCLEDPAVREGVLTVDPLAVEKMIEQMKFLLEDDNYDAISSKVQSLRDRLPKWSQAAEVILDNIVHQTPEILHKC